MGKRKEQRKAAYNKREEEKAKKVLRNVIIREKNKEKEP